MLLNKFYFYFYFFLFDEKIFIRPESHYMEPLLTISAESLQFGYFLVDSIVV